MSQTNTLSGNVSGLEPNTQGFDTNTVLTALTAKEFYESGYRYCTRYVGRTQMASNDLSSTEANAILDAGLGLMVVQHVSAWNWTPTSKLGIEYGTNAAAFAKEIGIPPGVNLWCDLEGVATDCPSDMVIDYCNYWYNAVNNAGYTPGLYVGAQCILNGTQLYEALSFKHYWKSGSTVPDVKTRGYQLIQHNLDVTVNGVQIDQDTSQNDHLGGQAQCLFREEPTTT